MKDANNNNSKTSERVENISNITSNTSHQSAKNKNKLDSTSYDENSSPAEAIAGNYARRVAISFLRLSATNLNRFMNSLYLDLKAEIEDLLVSNKEISNDDTITIPHFDKSYVFFNIDGVQRKGYVISGNITIEYDAQTAHVVKMQHLLNIDLVKLVRYENEFIDGQVILPEEIESRIILPESEVFRIWKKLE